MSSERWLYRVHVGLTNFEFSLNFWIHRDSNFIHGLPVNNLDSIAAGSISLSDADRVRLVHDYVTWTAADGGLAVVPGAEQWGRVTNIMAVHDQEFNERWLKAWSTRGVGSVDLDKIKDHVSHLLNPGLALFLTIRGP